MTADGVVDDSAVLRYDISIDSARLLHHMNHKLLMKNSIQVSQYNCSAIMA